MARTPNTKRRNRRDDTAAVDLPHELDAERALDTTQVSVVLGVAPITLAQWRAKGQGPRFFRASARAVRYRLGDVIAFRDAKAAGKVSP